MFRTNAEVIVRHYEFSQDGAPKFSSHPTRALVREMAKSRGAQEQHAPGRAVFLLPPEFVNLRLDDEIIYQRQCFQLQTIAPHYDLEGHLRAMRCEALN